MTPFAILAPDLAKDHARLLRVAVQNVKLQWSAPISAIDLQTPRHILSVGKSGLDAWHDFGLIQVGANHGDVFTHRGVNGRTFVVMVVEHPSAMQQLSAFGKYSAREDMVRDLTRWRQAIQWASAGHGFFSAVCGGCMKSKSQSVVRPAEHWVAELDGVGLCEDHYRRRANYTRKRRSVPVKDRGKMEHQIEGQGEMFGGDGTKVLVRKS